MTDPQAGSDKMTRLSGVGRPLEAVGHFILEIGHQAFGMIGGMYLLLAETLGGIAAGLFLPNVRLGREALILMQT